MSLNKKSCPKAVIMGLNSGTSVDSIDIVLVEFEENEPNVISFKLLDYQKFPFEESLRRQVFDACANHCSVAEICELNFWIGQTFGEAASQMIAQNKTQSIDLIASHGQTIYHQMAEGRRRSTLQLGEAAVVANLCDLSVASNFRVADVVAGGQGAPLAGYFDYLFFRDETQARAVLNLGGIASITYLPTQIPSYAFDTGPGNMLIDYAAQYYSNGLLTYDRDGVMAQAGQVNSQLLAELMTTHFLQENPPKSTGRENFGEGFSRDLIWACEQSELAPKDVMATLTAFTVQSIAKAHQNFGPHEGIRELIVSGGGISNPTLMNGLIEAFPGVKVRSHDEFGIPAGCKEAVTFALLGYEVLRGQPANLPCSTGAQGPRILGQLTPGCNYSALLQKFAPFMQNYPSAKTYEQEIWQPKRKLILKK